MSPKNPDPYKVKYTEKRRRRMAAPYRIRIVSGETELVPNKPQKEMADDLNLLAEEDNKTAG
ncbi:MAG: hypothetical protein ACYSR9_08565 [Planctomycetota bacterium]